MAEPFLVQWDGDAFVPATRHMKRCDAEHVLKCSVDDCGRQVSAKGYCGRHYMRFKRYGNPLAKIGERAESYKGLEFLETSLGLDTNDCVIWSFSAMRGYPKVTLRNGIRAMAHRVVCEKKHGPPPGLDSQAAHSCGNGHIGCINWKHLRWATQTENMADRLIHGTSNRGSRHGVSKLTESDVLEIRRLVADGLTQRAIAERFGVTQGAISCVHRGIVWEWLK